MRFIPIFIVAIILMSCDKDSFTTKPQVTFKSVNSKVISGAQTIQLKFEITDKEGDFAPFIGLKKTVRGCPASNRTDSTTYSIPNDFLKTKQTKGELVITLTQIKRGGNACTVPGGGPRPDTSTYKIWIRDMQGNKSDTAFAEEIIILN